MIDYHDIEFRGGLELHQQINTRKLFCECPTEVRHDEHHVTTKRKLHAVASELGEYDPAALHEAHRDRTFHYQSYRDTVCLVEIDEEPPHPVNRNALKVVAQVAMVLNARMVDEIQVMRKTVIDGSNTAGFQRTMLVATDGKIATAEGDVTLQYFCLEEDAARIIETEGRNVNFRLDRLGIPLLEIVTGPNFKSPAQAGEGADRLGHIIRSLNVRRGIGSIRQDVNVSTKYGTRIEIKGVQRHRMIPTIMAYEAQRQVSLYNIARELRDRREPFDESFLKQCTHVLTDEFRNSESRVIRSVIDKGGKVIAVALPAFRGFIGRELCPGKRLGTELKDQVLTLGIEGLLHSDEDLSAYGFSAKEVDSIRSILQCGDNDGFIVFASREQVVQKALDKLYTRIVACFDGVPKESRRALKDGNTQYMRPLPGEARMYPETDIPPVVMNEELKERIEKSIPEILETKLERLSEKSSIPLHELWKIEEYIEAFLYGVDTLGMDPAFVYRVIGSNVVDMRRQTGKDFDNGTLKNLLEALHTKNVLVEAVPEVLTGLAAGEKLDDIITSINGEKVNLETAINNVIESQNGILQNPKRHAILMGELMRTLRGRIDGRTISDALEKALKNIDQ
ncbi:Glu-tRNA(Gln) amidotransferase subunit GatE [candidate division KSB1 bacterium]